ncbi:MFS transporter [Edaphobacter bradus]|uniref:MFS transporter n=1 Tax=Edaphobacter bradus TaxID=2259016 RepID=UPI0021DFD616|nr:MFS transporter [Edaphobacter bradus]
MLRPIGSAPRYLKSEFQHYLGAFLLQLAMMIAMTVIPFFTFQHLGGRERAAAMAYGVQVLSLGVACLLSASFISVLPNVLLCCLIGSAGFGVFYSTAILARNVISFCVLTGMAMLFFALAWPALQSWLGAQRDAALRAKSFSYFNLSIGIGLTLGPFIAGLLYGVDYRLPFLATLLLSIVSGLLLFALPHEREYFTSVPPVCPAELNVTSTLQTDADNEAYLYCGWLSNMLGWGLTGAVRTVYAGRLDQLVQQGRLVLFSPSLPLHVFTAQHGPSAATLYSWMQSVLSLGFFLTILVMGRTVRWQHQFWPVIASLVLLGGGIWLLADSHSLIVILLCHAIIGAFTGFGYMGSQCYSAANVLHKHKRLALNEGFSHSTGFFLPLAFAQLGTWYGITWPFTHTPAILAVFIALQFLSLRYAKRNAAAATLSTWNV